MGADRGVGCAGRGARNAMNGVRKDRRTLRKCAEDVNKFESAFFFFENVRVKTRRVGAK